MALDRLKELDKLLEELRKANTNNYSDIDLVLTYLEKFLSDPKIGGGSKKFEEMEIKRDPLKMCTIYQISWKKLDYEKCTNQVIEFCKKNNILCHIKYGTPKISNKKTVEMFRKVCTHPLTV